MWLGVVSLFPPMLKAVTDYGITGRAVDQGLLAIECWNPRDFATDKHRTVDDRPYGGGPGMLMTVEPLRAAINAARQAAGGPTKVAYLSPQGQRLDQAAVAELAQRERMILVAGRYEGIDERVIAADVDEEWSIGDYVVSGGELPLMVLIDAVTRLLPGALGHVDSAREDSFNDLFNHGLLDCPHYTRPEQVGDQRVPQVLLNGHHEEIRRWRLKQSLGRTWLRRPDLLEELLRANKLDQEQLSLLEEFKREQVSKQV